MLEGKKILFISPKFFGYELEIKKKMESLGAQVDYFDERPKNTFLVKFLIRINKDFIKKKINKYYTDIINQNKNKHYDFVFFLNPEAISKELLIELKKEHKKAEFILYMWDSLKNKKIQDLLEIFDKRFSFDKTDCINQKIEINYRPLFYLDEYPVLANKKVKKKYDILFIGTLHSDRNKILKDIIKECKKKELNYFFYLYFPSKVIYLIKRIYDKSLWGTSIKDFKFTPISKDELLFYVNFSNVVIDIQHPMQTGLTMRTIEMLGANKKIMTTNKNIVENNFYNPLNIAIIDRKNVKLQKSFFNNNYQKVDLEIFYKYSLDGWIHEIFCQ